MEVKLKKIDANDRTVRDVLGKKFNIDFFQREYNWQRKHVEQLLFDLEGKFKSSYDENHDREDVENYARYYLGPIILSEKKDLKSIIDGQQRLTSLTLLLIFLKHLVTDDQELSADIIPLIKSTRHGRKSLNLEISDRAECMEGLLREGKYDINGENESVRNIVKRYNDIEELFPEDLKDEVLPFFIDWLIDNVILVEIITYSDDDAYTIFETMNDRGLSLSPTQMLKGYLLSKIKSEDDKNNLNEIWRSNIQKLHKIDDKEDLEFFKAWLRAKYADTIREGKKGAPNEDFEKIGTRYHSWVRDNISRIELTSSSNVFHFIDRNFCFFTEIYLKIHRATNKLTEGLESIFYINERGLASSLYFPLLLSPIKLDDHEDVINRKMALVAYYLELFVVFRSVNRRNFSQSAIRYTMYNLVKEIRNKDIDFLIALFKQKASDLEEGLEGIQSLILHGQNKRFIKFLLARITHYIEKQSGVQSRFEDYIDPDIRKPYEIEHIWANKYEEHLDEFDQRDEFESFRNHIGALVLVQKGFNQSFNDLPYNEKLPHYQGQNLLTRSLHTQTYERNPSFLSFIRNSGLNFKAHHDFKKQDVLERQALYQDICERIWDVNYFDIIKER